MNTEKTGAEALGPVVHVRGHELVKFKDHLGAGCTIRPIGAPGIGQTLLRIGLEKAKPMIEAQDARALGLSITKQKTGLVRFEIPAAVRIETQMVLTRDQAIGVYEYLGRWLSTNNLSIRDTDSEHPGKLTFEKLKTLKAAIDAENSKTAILSGFDPGAGDDKTVKLELKPGDNLEGFDPDTKAQLKKAIAEHGVSDTAIDNPVGDDFK